MERNEEMGFVLGSSPVAERLEKLGFRKVDVERADPDLLRLILKILMAWLGEQGQLPLVIYIKGASIYVAGGESNCGFAEALLRRR